MKFISFYFKKRKIKIPVEKVSGIEKGIGLMFSSRKNAKALLFEFDKPKKIAIHSLFVFFPFFALWLNGKNRIVEIKRVNPFSLNIAQRKSAEKLIEIPLSHRYKKILHLLFGKKNFREAVAI